MSAGSISVHDAQFKALHKLIRAHSGRISGSAAIWPVWGSDPSQVFPRATQGKAGKI